MEIQKVIISNYKSLYSTKFENLDEMDNILDTYQVLTLKQDQISLVNSSISPEEIEAVVNSLPTKKRLRPDGISRETIRSSKKS